jgi:hypothetical protein
MAGGTGRKVSLVANICDGFSLSKGEISRLIRLTGTRPSGYMVRTSGFDGCTDLQSDPLHLVLRQALLRAVTELRRPRALMGRHGLRVFQHTAVAEIGGDASRTKCMVADRCVNAGGNCTAADHAPGVRLRHGLLGQHRRIVPGAGAKQLAFAVFRDAGDIDVGAQCVGKRVVARHGVLLAALLVQQNLPACALRPQILHLHAQGRCDAGERVGEGGDQCAVAHIAHSLGRNTVDEFAPFFPVEHRCLASFDDELRATDSRGRIHRRDLAGDEPIEHHPHGSELLLHARRRPALDALFRSWMSGLARHAFGGDGLISRCLVQA